jgi:glutathione S-transferase
VKAKLYYILLSHPSEAARQMLQHKGIEIEPVLLLGGIHPGLIRARGFRRNTVPAIRIEGRRVQGSREIAHALEEIKPDPPLFPADPAARAAVEEAEAWGESHFQRHPRRLFRWGITHGPALRRWAANDVFQMPAGNLMAELNRPVAWALARAEQADDQGAQEVIGFLPGDLDRVDQLIADGVIGGADRNAADFQILTTVRTLTTFTDLEEWLGDRPCARLARELWPDAIGPVPPVLPPEWLARLGEPASATAG